MEMPIDGAQHRLMLAREEARVTRARAALQQLMAQLDTADAYAKDENPGPVPSTWQLQNALLREQAALLAKLLRD